jgi:hypothetical protein
VIADLGVGVGEHAAGLREGMGMNTNKLWIGAGAMLLAFGGGVVGAQTAANDATACAHDVTGALRLAKTCGVHERPLTLATTDTDTDARLDFTGITEAVDTERPEPG